LTAQAMGLSKNIPGKHWGAHFLMQNNQLK